MYDRRGRLVRSVTTREPEWSEEDQAWMLALAAHRAGRCPVCGRDRDECGDPDFEDRWVVDDPARCYATTAISAKAKDYAESAPHPHALLYHAHRR